MDESVVKVFEQLRVGKLKLSEAMRIGARLRPQAMGSYCDATGTCAFGAAAEAMYGGSDSHIRANAHRLTENIIYVGIVAVVLNRNDNGHSRESIADWLESKGL